MHFSISKVKYIYYYVSYLILLKFSTNEDSYSAVVLSGFPWIFCEFLVSILCLSYYGFWGLLLHFSYCLVNLHLMMLSSLGEGGLPNVFIFYEWAWAWIIFYAWLWWWVWRPAFTWGSPALSPNILRTGTFWDLIHTYVWAWKRFCAWLRWWMRWPFPQ